tara:strand:- start:42 stop:362 length:321 start_codon:yes stop_codon:yes gene_type:complete
MPRYKMMNNVKVQFTAEEEAERDAQEKEWNDKKGERKLAEIKQIRLKKLQETDYLALSDVTMSDAMTTYRQVLRNIPQDYTTESQYDLLLARDIDGNLTHTIWEKP